MSSILQLPGQAPIQMIVQGSDTEIGLARQAVAQQHGQIAQFVASARARSTGAEQGSAVRQLPGLQMRYQRNQGQERIIVQAAVEQPTTSPQEQPITIPQVTARGSAMLAIDIVFDHEMYDAIDVTSYEEVDVPSLGGIQRFYSRQRVRYFDHVIAAALQVNDSAGNYSALIRDGGNPFPEQDPRLRSLDGVGANYPVTRDALDPAGATYIHGRGFVARPVRDLATTSIQVYLASQNTAKTNSYPDGLDVNVTDDHPSLTYAVKNALRWKIRVREFYSPREDGVEELLFTGSAVLLNQLQQSQLFTPPPGPEGAPGFNQPPTEPGSIVEISRFVGGSENFPRWGFAVLEGWTDANPAGDPTDPALSGSDRLGKLLAELEQEGPIAGPMPVPRQNVLLLPDWQEPISDMTLVATIVWQPAQSVAGGTAEIVPA